jgi:hypothetical protein
VGIPSSQFPEPNPQLSDYLKENHPQYRLATLRKVYAIIQSLKEWPYRGRVGREEGTRERCSEEVSTICFPLRLFHHHPDEYIPRR